MNKFYQNVLKDFIQLLQKQYKGKSFLSSDKISKIEKELRTKIKTPSAYHKRLISDYFQTSRVHQSQSQEPLVFCPKTKENIVLMDNVQKFPQAGLDNQLCVPVNLPQQRSCEEDQEDDDLNQFKNSQLMAQNELVVNTTSSFQKQEELQFSQLSDLDLSQDLEIIQNNNFSAQEMTNLKSRIGVHIVGQYNTKAKKFNNKREETRILLQNAFVKIEGHQQQIFWPQVQVTLKKAYKSVLPLGEQKYTL